MYDLLIKNGRLVTPDRIFEAEIAIQDGSMQHSWHRARKWTQKK